MSAKISAGSGYENSHVISLFSPNGLNKPYYFDPYFAGKGERFHFCGELLTDMLERELALDSSPVVTETGCNAAMQLVFGFLSLAAVEGGAADWNQLRKGLHLFSHSC
jgi:hypothetical protein